MPVTKLPSPEMGMGVEELTNLMFRYYRELQYILGHLDSDNISEIDAHKTRVLNLEQLVAETIIAGDIVTNTFVTNTLYASYARIAQLTVDELSTGWEKITNYLAGSTADVNYLYIHDQTIDFITATTTGASTRQETKRDGTPLYWIDETHTGVTDEANAFPVTTYVYTELTKAHFTFTLVGENYIPQLWLGAGTGSGNNGKSCIWKGTDGLYLDYYHSTTGELRRIMLTDDGADFDESGGISGISTKDSLVSATNIASITITTSEVTAIAKDVELSYRSKALIHFSCEITLSGAANVTAKTYIDGTVSPYQPTMYCGTAQAYVFNYTDVKNGIESGTKTMQIKLATDANSGTISINHAVLAVQIFDDPAPIVNGPTKAYVTGGTGGSYLQDTDEYSPDTWVSKSNIPTPARTGHASCNISSKGYVFGGYGTSALQDTDEYSPDTWVSKSDMPSPGRYYIASCNISSKGYAFGGYTAMSDTDEYSPDTWVSKSDMPSPGRSQMPAFTVSGKGYIAGGGTNSSFFSDTDEYSPDTWVSKSNIPTPARRCHAGYVINLKGYIVGGLGPGAMSDTDEYSPDTWVSKSDMPSPGRHYPTSSAVADKGYAFGGYSTANLQDTDEYSPDTWVSKSDMPSPGRRESASCAL